MSTNVTEEIDTVTSEPGVEITRRLTVEANKKGNLVYVGVVRFDPSVRYHPSVPRDFFAAILLTDSYSSKKLHKVQEWLRTWGKRFELLVEPTYKMKTTVPRPDKVLEV